MGKDVCGILGHPVSHSLSPQIFEFLAIRLKRPLLYRKLDVPPGRLRAFVGEALRRKDFRGWNVTIPHKVVVARFCSDLSDAARAMGSVNVVEFRGKRGPRGYNTDVIGIRETFREQKFKPRGREAVIYGAGGAAIAVGFVLGELGARRVVFEARTAARARRLALRLSRLFPRTCFEVGSTPRVAQDCGFDLYVNATPLGMKGFAKNELLPRDARKGALAFDLIYRPEKTSFLTAARRRGLRTVGGLDMLIWQAIGTWEIWFGPVRGRAELKAALVRRLRGMGRS